MKLYSYTFQSKRSKQLGKVFPYVLLFVTIPVHMYKNIEFIPYVRTQWEPTMK